MKYTDKLINKEFDNVVIKAHKLKPVQASLECFNLIRMVTPSLGALGDLTLGGNREMGIATAFNMLSRNTTSEQFESLQLLLLGSISKDGEPLEDVKNINDFLEANPDLNIYDLLVWLFENQLLSGVLSSILFKSNKEKMGKLFTQIKGVLDEENTTED